MSVEIVQDMPRVVQISGDIDLSNVDTLSAALDAAAQESPKGFIIDLSRTSYIDSAGIAAIMSAYKYVHPRGGKIALVVGNPNVKEIISLVHPEKLPGMPVYESLSSAQRDLCPSLEEEP